MPIDKDLKRLVRARMAVTNENYTTARAALVPADPRVNLRALVSRLADPAAAHDVAAREHGGDRLGLDRSGSGVAGLVDGAKQGLGKAEGIEGHWKR